MPKKNNPWQENKKNQARFPSENSEDPEDILE